MPCAGRRPIEHQIDQSFALTFLTKPQLSTHKLMNKIAILLCFSGVAAAAWGAEIQDYPIRPVPFTAVQVQDNFWSPRMETNRVTTVWYDFKKCEETGRIDNFAKAGKLMPGEFRGTPFDDSDVFKVIEGAAYTLALHPDPDA